LAVLDAAVARDGTRSHESSIVLCNVVTRARWVLNSPYGMAVAAEWAVEEDHQT